MNIYKYETHDSNAFEANIYDNFLFIFLLQKTNGKEVKEGQQLSVKYPVLTLSSENLADDEREDTSEGEVEPEPDYDLDECCGKVVLDFSSCCINLADFL